MNYGQHAQNFLHSTFRPFGANPPSFVTPREDEIVGLVPIGRVYYVPPAKQMEEACIRVLPDIPIP